MKRQHPSERDFAARRVTPGQFFRDGLRCYCFSESDSKTESATKQVADEGILAEGSQVTKAGDFSDVQSGGIRNEDKGTVIALEAASKLTTGVDLAAATVGGDVTVTTADPQLVGAALAEVSRLGTNFSGTIADLNATVLDKIGDLALSQQTEGETERNKTILYIALAGLGVLGVWAWRKTD